MASGRELALLGPVEVTAMPGSALKPLVLEYALEHRLLRPQETVLCEGRLRIAGHNLACVHARGVVTMDARSALAQSCNAYFAALGRRLPGQVPIALESFGLHEPAVSAPDEGALMTLGLTGEPVSVRQMARAYRQLALRMNAGVVAASLVKAAMLDSVSEGAAHGAMTDGVALAGKTGTAPHAGWFAGILLDKRGKASGVLVVRVAGGNGYDAAVAAHRALAQQR